MLLDGARMTQVAVAALAWSMAYMILKTPLRQHLDDAIHGIAFLALFAVLCAAILAFQFRRLTTVRANLIAGIALSRWQVARDAFARAEASKSAVSNRVGPKLLLDLATAIFAGRSLRQRVDDRGARRRRLSVRTRRCLPMPYDGEVLVWLGQVSCAPSFEWRFNLKY